MNFFWPAKSGIYLWDNAFIQYHFSEVKSLLLPLPKFVYYTVTDWWWGQYVVLLTHLKVILPEDTVEDQYHL